MGSGAVIIALGINLGIGAAASGLSLLSQNERHGMQDKLSELGSVHDSTVRVYSFYFKVSLIDYLPPI